MADEHLSQKETAKRLGITPREVRNLGKRDDDSIPRGDDGKYPWPEARDWYVRFKQEELLRRRGLDEGGSYQDARAKKTAMQARLAELEVFRREGELVALSDIAVLVHSPLEAVDAALKSAPSRHAPELAAAAGLKVQEAKRHLDTIMEEVRSSLRDARGDSPYDLVKVDA